MAEEQGVKEQETEAANQSEQSDTEGQPQAEQAVPYKRFSEVNEAKNRAEAEANVLREQMKIMAANPPQNPYGSSAGQGYSPPDYLEGLQIDIDEDGELSPAQKKAINYAIAKYSKVVEAFGASLQFQQSNPDYRQIVGADGVMAPALTKYLQKNPLALTQIKAHPQPWAYLYTLGKAAIEAEKAGKKPADKTKTTEENEEEAEQTTVTRPSSPAILGGRAAFSKGDRFSKMTKEEFEKHIATVKSKG